MLIFKCKTVKEADKAVKLLCKELRSLCLKPVADRPKVCNIVGTTNIGFNLNLAAISQITDHTEYEPDLYVSLFASVLGVKATVTHTGKVIIFGAKSKSFLLRLLEKYMILFVSAGTTYKTLKWTFIWTLFATFRTHRKYYPQP